jgi:O-antigen ligase
MISFWQKNKNQIVLIILFIIILGLFFSRAAISIGTGLLSFIAVISIEKNKLKNLLIPKYLVFILMYFLFLVSFFNTKDLLNYNKLIFLELPLLIFPLFFSQYHLSAIVIKKVLQFYVIITCIVCLGTIINFALDYKQQTENIINAKAIPAITGIVHYQFALLIVIAIVCCYSLIHHQKIQKKKLWICLMWFLILAIHLLAYRTALFAFYFLLALYLYKIFGNSNQLRSKLIVIFSCLSLLVLAVLFYKPLNLKIKVTYQDISKIINHENFNDYSIAQRYAATLNSFEIIKKNIWFGVSPADVGAEMKVQYEIDSYLLVPKNRIGIHNQYFFYFMSFGIIAFVFWTVLWFYNIVKSYLEKNAGFYILIIASLVFLIDNFFQIQLGFTSILLFYYLLYTVKTSNNLENRYI